MVRLILMCSLADFYGCLENGWNSEIRRVLVMGHAEVSQVNASRIPNSQKFLLIRVCRMEDYRCSEFATNFRKVISEANLYSEAYQAREYGLLDDSSLISDVIKGTQAKCLESFPKAQRPFEYSWIRAAFDAEDFCQVVWHLDNKADHLKLTNPYLGFLYFWSAYKIGDLRDEKNFFCKETPTTHPLENLVSKMQMYSEKGKLFGPSNWVLTRIQRLTLSPDKPLRHLLQGIRETPFVWSMYEELLDHLKVTPKDKEDPDIASLLKEVPESEVTKPVVPESLRMFDCFPLEHSDTDSKLDLDFDSVGETLFKPNVSSRHSSEPELLSKPDYWPESDFTPDSESNDCPDPEEGDEPAPELSSESETEPMPEIPDLPLRNVRGLLLPDHWMSYLFEATLNMEAGESVLAEHQLSVIYEVIPTSSICLRLSKALVAQATIESTGRANDLIEECAEEATQRRDFGTIFEYYYWAKDRRALGSHFSKKDRGVGDYSPEYYLGLGNLYSLYECHEAACQVLCDGIVEYRHETRLWLAAAREYSMREGYLNVAGNLYYTVTLKEPYNLTALYGVGVCLYKANRFGHAAHYFQRANQASFDNSPTWLWVAKGLNEFQMNATHDEAFRWLLTGYRSGDGSGLALATISEVLQNQATSESSSLGAAFDGLTVWLAFGRSALTQCPECVHFLDEYKRNPFAHLEFGDFLAILLTALFNLIENSIRMKDLVLSNHYMTLFEVCLPDKSIDCKPMKSRVRKLIKVGHTLD